MPHANLRPIVHLKHEREVHRLEDAIEGLRHALHRQGEYHGNAGATYLRHSIDVSAALLSRERAYRRWRQSYIRLACPLWGIRDRGEARSSQQRLLTSCRRSLIPYSSTFRESVLGDDMFPPRELRLPRHAIAARELSCGEF